MAESVKLTEVPESGDGAAVDQGAQPIPPAEARARAFAPEARPADKIADAPAIAAAAEPQARRRRGPSLRTLLMVGGIFVVLAGTFFFWLRGGRYATTDDAFVEAAKLLVTTDVSGLVSSVDVHDNQKVKAGQMLFQIDPQQFQYALDNAVANLHETALTIESMKADYQMILRDIDAQQSQVDLDQVTFDRFSALVGDQSVTRAEYDQARYTLQLDRNKLESLRQQARVQLAKLNGDPNIQVTEHPLYRQAKAQVDEAQRQLNHASVHAPFAGVVTQVDALQPGTYLFAQTAALTGTGAVALVSDENLWVTAQLKETELTYVRPGDHVDISVDTYPGRVWSGRVESISPASGAQFSVLPAENSSGNYVKVVQRIPVRIAIDRGQDAPILRAGMSVYVSIDTKHQRSLGDLLHLF